MKKWGQGAGSGATREGKPLFLCSYFTGQTPCLLVQTTMAVLICSRSLGGKSIF